MNNMEKKEFKLTITANDLLSNGENITIDDITNGSNYKAIDAYFENSNSEIITRKREKGERHISNQTISRIAFQIFEEQISALSEEEKLNFPICQYSHDPYIYRGIFPSIEEFKKYRNTAEFMIYKYGENKQFIIYAWSVFTNILFLQECLKRFGQSGDQFVLTYCLKSTNEENELENPNYWLFVPRNYDVSWDKFYNEGLISIGLEKIGDASIYKSKEEIEKAISKAENREKRPTNDALAVWQFCNEMKKDDVIFVKTGIDTLVGRGIVTSDYYYDEEDLGHTRKVEWTHKGEWIIDFQIAGKVLTEFYATSPETIQMENMILDVTTNESDKFIDEYKNWLQKQVRKDGELLDFKTIGVKITSLKAYENDFNIKIFGETDIDVLKGYKELLNSSKDYEKYKGQHSTNLNKYIHFLEYKPIIKSDAIKYDMDQFLDEVFMDKADVNTLTSILRNRKNLILKGAPGVGKTFVADRLAYLMMSEKDSSRITMIQFHQSYSYEDFIEGYRPNNNGDGFELNEGPFVKFARKAHEDPSRDYFFIIDEINRGNMSKVFGELMMLIETDKRGKSINLLYSNEKFLVPENLYIIGMMNTADRSLALLDYALRRRFTFYDVTPAFENKTFLSQNKVPNNIIELIKVLNIEIKNELGSGFQIGHSYFTNVEGKQRIKEVIEYEIIPQLQEYWFDDEDKAHEWASQLRGALDGI